MYPSKTFVKRGCARKGMSLRIVACAPTYLFALCRLRRLPANGERKGESKRILHEHQRRSFYVDYRRIDRCCSGHKIMGLSMPCAFAWILLFTTLSTAVAAKECTDGKDNVISIHDVLDENKSIAFNDVKIYTYGPDGKVLCKPALTFPGFLKIASGSITVTEPLTSSNGHIQLAFTVEQNSFMVGKVCENGISKNSFVPNEICKLDLCAVAPALCKIFEEAHSISTSDLPSDYGGLVPLGPLDMSVVAGEWKASISLSHGDAVVAGIQIGDSDKWTTIVLGDERDVKTFEKTQEKLKLSKGKEEL
uniref:Peptidase A1 domain-containing protein n=1 Tax=Panagrellus redivivus TaxID=6233 RepID=A0A7E5A1L8_PANRE